MDWGSGDDKDPYEEMSDEELARLTQQMLTPNAREHDPLGFGARTAELESKMAPPVLMGALGRVQVPLHRMGEAAAIDSYTPPLHSDPHVARALELAGPGMPEDKAYGYPRFPDAASENQRPPPQPPFLRDNAPAWATEQQGTPQFWMEGTQADDPQRGYDL